MARLALSLLGSFTATLDGALITTFESHKVRALLAYLAAETDRPHRRETLATLLWPDWPQQSAMSNLRYALADLRKNIGDRNAQPPPSEKHGWARSGSECSSRSEASEPLTPSP
jgi:DNA-binding SARP family transcriptional activator